MSQVENQKVWDVETWDRKTRICRNVWKTAWFLTNCREKSEFVLQTGREHLIVPSVTELLHVMLP
jgi:hypothetical protein